MSDDLTYSVDNPIILFDGQCNLCGGLAGIIRRSDKYRKFVLATMQGKVGSQLLMNYGLDGKGLDSVVLIDSAGLFIKSQAIFRIIEHLGGLWTVFLVFKLFPLGFNDYLYDLIARNRYKIFGKRKKCMIIQ